MTDLLVKSQQLLKSGSDKDIKDFLPDLIVGYETLDADAGKTELNYDLYRIERYEHRKAKKNK